MSNRHPGCTSRPLLSFGLTFTHLYTQTRINSVQTFNSDLQGTHPWGAPGTTNRIWLWFTCFFLQDYSTSRVRLVHGGSRRIYIKATFKKKTDCFEYENFSAFPCCTNTYCTQRHSDVGHWLDLVNNHTDTTQNTLATKQQRINNHSEQFSKHTVMPRLTPTETACMGKTHFTFIYFLNKIVSINVDKSSQNCEWEVLVKRPLQVKMSQDQSNSDIWWFRGCWLDTDLLRLARSLRSVWFTLTSVMPEGE